MNAQKILRALCFPALFLLFVTAVSAQSRTVTGKILTANGAPVDGASVLIKGTSVGTSTNKEGAFSINMPSGSSILVVSYIGYQPQEFDVTGKSTVEIKLTESDDKLTDVVVVGYGTQKKREVTSAVATIKAEDFNKGNISNVSQLLQGKVAGLSVARPGGDPNGGFAIRLRGLSTLGANAQPLVVIDGQIGADLNTVDPNDIASFDILKDGSAAAIYGTRGSQGVIIITTKSGARGASSVNYSGFVSSEKAARLTKHMSAEEFRDLGKGTDYGASTDWYEEITRNALSHTHNLSFSGGNSSGTTYNASVNYRDVDGIAITTGFKQLNGRLNLTQKALNNKLVFNFGLTTTRREAALGYPEAFKYAAIYNPTAPVYSDDPLFDLSGGGYYEANFIDYANPVAALQQNNHDLEIKRLNLVGSAEYEIIKGLKFLVRYAQQTSSSFEQAYLPRNSYHSRNFLGVSGFARGGYGFKGDFETFSQLYENTLSYDKKLTSKLNLNALAGYSYQDFLNQGESMAGGDFVTDASADNLASARDFTTGRGTINSYKNASKLVAFFGRINLNYNNVAFLSASLRREGATQLGENNKWGMFPAVSAGLDLSKMLNLSNVQNFKFRASYGVTGALPAGPYQSLQSLTTSGNYFYAGNGVYLQSYVPAVNENPDLKWESKAELDFGLDISALNNRLTATVDYYNRTTSDLIFQATVPVPPNPAPLKYLNVGELKSSGVEISAGYNILRDKLIDWTTNINFSSFNVKLSNLNEEVGGTFIGATNLGTPGQEATQITRAIEGEKIGVLWGWIYDGVDKDGKYILRDLNGDDQINGDDRTIIGNGLPKFELGWNNTFRYKNWDLNFFLRGSFGHDLINTYRAFYENPNIATSYNVVNTKFFNPDITDGQIFSSLFVEKASFVKLDNATIGYNFKVKGNSFKSIRAYIAGQNLFVITDYTGADPEVRFADGSNVLAPGVDRRETWVLTRTFTFGVNIGF